MEDELKALLQDVTYWKAVTAFQIMMKTICSCLTYLEGDEATFSSVYACFLAVKVHIMELSESVKTALGLDGDDIAQMITFLHHRLHTIYSPAHCLAFVTDPLFASMREAVALKYTPEFIEMSKGSVNQQVPPPRAPLPPPSSLSPPPPQAKTALLRIANGDVQLQRKLFTEFAAYLMRGEHDVDFQDVAFKPADLWSLSDDTRYGSLKVFLSALHRNPAGAAGGERNHKAAKRVHSRHRVRLGATRIESGTAILFNSRQLERSLSVSREIPFCRWLKRLCTDEDDNGGAKNEDEGGEGVGDAGDEAAGEEEGFEDDFERLDLSRGSEGIEDSSLFDDEEVLDEGQV